MPILNYTTSIDANKSILEITKCLTAHGAHKITTDYQNSHAVAITFCITINGQMVAFNLPANYQGVLKAMQKSKKITRKKCTTDQALRVAWRILKDWIEAQMAIVEAQMADMAEVFLPYAVTNTGSTLYQQIKNSGTGTLLLENTNN